MILTATKPAQMQKPLFYEALWRRPLTTRLKMLNGFLAIVALLAGARMLLSKPDDISLFVCPMVVCGVLSVFIGLYSEGLPMTVTVTEENLVLWKSKLNSRRVPLYATCALRYVPFRPAVHSGIRVHGSSPLEWWAMNGKRVLEIETRAGARIHLASPRCHELASLLHEMTRVPVEDCR